MNTLLTVIAATASVACAQYPAVPLITHDPYLSVWSMSPRLTDDWPRHWSGEVNALSGMVWVDGKAYRWCGPMPQSVPAATQTSVTVNLESTQYTFQAGDVELRVTFSSPMGMAQDMSLASETISTVSFSASSSSGSRSVRIYLDLTGEWCTNSSSDLISWSRYQARGLDVVSLARTDQPVLVAAGDRRKIDWGRLFLAVPDNAQGHTRISGHEASRNAFVSKGALLDADDLRQPRAARDDWPVLAATIDLGAVTTTRSAPRHLLIGYDERRAIELHERALRPYWHAVHGDDFSARLSAASERADVSAGADNAQVTFLAEARRVGGDRYASLVTLAFRQVMAGHKIVADWDNTPLMFSKENTSNGCIGTIDVIYPACPFFLYHNPAMLEAQLRPLLDYAASPRWKFPFAPHDLGTYPKANGQVYGGGERTEENQMPVEESGNMLIMIAALAKVNGNADFAKPYAKTLDAWANYLEQHGLDPVNQLCTDDFAGHLARNANLSAKTCVALGAYAQWLAMAGREDDAARWRTTAESFATKWMELSEGSQATVLVFGGNSDSWSQKYNLIWDQVLDLQLFPPEVFAREMGWYKGKLNQYGLPLDSRQAYTKLDWTVWTACLTRQRRDFDTIMAPVYAWAEAATPPSRVPLSDWYDTEHGRTMGMHTRTVVGGIWMPLLMEKMKRGMR